MADTKELVDAVSEGRLEEVKRLVDQGADARTALKYAAVFEQVGIARFLLEQGAAEARDQDGKTALINLAEDGRLRVVKFLVGLGVDKEAKSNDGKTALLWAAANDRLPVVTYLVEHGANKEASSRGGMTALIHAAWRGNLQVVQYLVDQGVNLEARDCEGKTALIVAAEEARLTVVKYLVRHGADKEVKDARGKTALVHAAWFGYVDVMDFLLQYDTGKETCDWDGQRASIRNLHAKVSRSSDFDDKAELMLAACQGRIGVCNARIDPSKNGLDTVTFLVEHGEDKNAMDPNGTTAIMHAARLGKLEVVRYLVEQGASILCVDDDGNTVLHHLVASTERIKFCSLERKGLKSASFQSPSCCSNTACPLLRTTQANW